MTPTTLAKLRTAWARYDRACSVGGGRPERLHWLLLIARAHGPRPEVPS